MHVNLLTHLYMATVEQTMTSTNIRMLIPSVPFTILTEHWEFWDMFFKSEANLIFNLNTKVVAMNCNIVLSRVIQKNTKLSCLHFLTHAYIFYILKYF